MESLKVKIVWLLIQVINRICLFSLFFPITRKPFLFAVKSSITPMRLKKYVEWKTRRIVVANPSLSNDLWTGKALIIYHSETGNTEKIARAIERGIVKAGLEPTVLKVSEGFDEDYYDYDLVCFGSPVRHSLPPSPVMELIKKKFIEYRNPPTEVQLPASPIPGKYALVFITFSGPHVGLDEALPSGKLLVQEFEHLGFRVEGEWYLVGEFHGWKEGSTKGKLGDIRGRPNSHDLKLVEEKTANLIRSLGHQCDSRIEWVLE
jgi:multimeric flavodoxin WrbA